jgi:hypothetical protein
MNRKITYAAAGVGAATWVTPDRWGRKVQKAKPATPARPAAGPQGLPGEAGPAGPEGRGAIPDRPGRKVTRRERRDASDRGTTGLNGLGPNNFMGMFSDVSVITEAAVQTDVPAAVTLSSFYVRGQASVGGGGGSITFTVRRNGADTGVGCTIPASGIACSDTTRLVAFDAGDLIGVASVRSGSPTSVRTW